MTPTPPYFLAQMTEQKQWNEGFKAGIAEVLHALEEGSADSDLEGPTKDWVHEFKQKISNKYL